MSKSSLSASIKIFVSTNINGFSPRPPRVFLSLTEIFPACLVNRFLLVFCRIFSSLPSNSPDFNALSNILRARIGLISATCSITVTIEKVSFTLALISESNLLSKSDLLDCDE